MVDYAEKLDAIRHNWYWMPGMKAIPTHAKFTADQCEASILYVIDVWKDRIYIAEKGVALTTHYWISDTRYVPDLYHVGTRGCLIAQLRERLFNDWRPWLGYDKRWHAGPYTSFERGYATEAEALLAALEGMQKAF